MVQWNPSKTDRAFQNIGHPKNKDILNCKISLKSALLLSVVTFLMIRPVGGGGTQQVLYGEALMSYE